MFLSSIEKTFVCKVLGESVACNLEGADVVCDPPTKGEGETNPDNESEKVLEALDDVVVAEGCFLALRRLFLMVLFPGAVETPLFPRGEVLFPPFPFDLDLLPPLRRDRSVLEGRPRRRLLFLKMFPRFPPRDLDRFPFNAR